jgi:hypothetical protein
MRRSQDHKAVDPKTFVAFLNSAVAFGKRFGINPHQDYPATFKICQGFSTDESNFDSYFSTSRPQFFVGPGDTKQRVAYVIEALQKSCGADGYDFYSILEPEFSDDEFLEDDDELED